MAIKGNKYQFEIDRSVGDNVLSRSATQRN